MPGAGAVHYIKCQASLRYGCFRDPVKMLLAFASIVVVVICPTGDPIGLIAALAGDPFAA